MCKGSMPVSITGSIQLFKEKATELLALLSEVQKIVTMGQDLYNSKVSEEHKAIINDLMDKLAAMYGMGKEQLLVSGERMSTAAVQVQGGLNDNFKVFQEKALALLERLKTNKTLASEVQSMIKTGQSLYNTNVSDEHKAAVSALVENLHTASKAATAAVVKVQGDIHAFAMMTTDEKFKLFKEKVTELLEKIDQNKTVLLSEVQKIVKMGQDLYNAKASKEQKAAINDLLTKLATAFERSKQRGNKIAADVMEYCKNVLAECNTEVKAAVAEFKSVASKEEPITEKLVHVFYFLLSYITAAVAFAKSFVAARTPSTESRVLFFKEKANELLEKMRGNKTVLLSEVQKIVTMGQDLYNAKVSEEHRAVISDLMDKLVAMYGIGKEQLLLASEKIENGATMHEKFIAAVSMLMIMVFREDTPVHKAELPKDAHLSTETPRTAASS
eukprot:TRINITY_DN216_c0_g1_i1.p2 TRINITY_DN216_c0_g1~~TRINITY_DN216_c0_g1_i1.p2  ORF type:complete len:444 (+),score=210.10 TRINITY_DN216_c0_g1_i1:60-1391(+)